MQTELLEVMRYTPKNKTAFTHGRAFYALSFRLSGQGRLTTATQTLTAKEKDLALFPRGLSYEHAAKDEDIIVFHFNIYDKPFSDLCVYTPADADAYQVLFTEALAIWEQKESGYLYKAQAVFYRILALMERDGFLHQVQRDPLMAECKSYSEAHYGDTDLTIAALAKRFGYSETYLRRRFAAAYGCAPKEYLCRHRLRQAAALLQSNYYTHAEIAEKCGYKEVKYFRWAFKAQFGMTITEYLKSLDTHKF